MSLFKRCEMCEINPAIDGAVVCKECYQFACEQEYENPSASPNSKSREFQEGDVVLLKSDYRENDGLIQGRVLVIEKIFVTKKNGNDIVVYNISGIDGTKYAGNYVQLDEYIRLLTDEELDMVQKSGNKLPQDEFDGYDAPKSKAYPNYDEEMNKMRDAEREEDGEGVYGSSLSDYKGSDEVYSKGETFVAKNQKKLYDGSVDVEAEWGEEPEIILSRGLYEELMAIVRYQGAKSQEVGGLLLVDYITHEGKPYIVLDKQIMLKQRATGGDFELDEEAMTTWMIKNRNKPWFRKIRGWWHSHHNMGLFWSGTDDEAFRILSTAGPCIGIVFVNNGNFLCRIDVQNVQFFGRFTLDQVPVTVGHWDEKEENDKHWVKFREKMVKRAEEECKKKIIYEPPVIKYSKMIEWRGKDAYDGKTHKKLPKKIVKKLIKEGEAYVPRPELTKKSRRKVHLRMQQAGYSLMNGKYYPPANAIVSPTPYNIFNKDSYKKIDDFVERATEQLSNEQAVKQLFAEKIDKENHEIMNDIIEKYKKDNPKSFYEQMWRENGWESDFKENSYGRNNKRNNKYL